ncbi:hypothetical protein GC089_03485 [Cellulomonas sp. JZ18]|nr:hypothetical protein GC089_03485 [Cellulomonas sp. JZ18]
MDPFRGTPSTARASPALAWGVAAAAAALALVVRWRALGGAAGLSGYHGYDDGVYYAAAAALVHGDVPYRDFLLLHPPGVALALAPFAALGAGLGDPVGLAAARVAFLLVGVASTVLVVRLAARWGTVAAVVGGVLYAVSAAAAVAERLTLLEPLGTLTLLGGVLLLRRAAEAAPARGRALVLLGGAVLGLGVTVKIWNVVPVAVVLACLWVGRGRGVAGRAALGRRPRPRACSRRSRCSPVRRCWSTSCSTSSGAGATGATCARAWRASPVSTERSPPSPTTRGRCSPSCWSSSRRPRSSPGAPGWVGCGSSCSSRRRPCCCSRRRTCRTTPRTPRPRSCSSWARACRRSPSGCVAWRQWRPA